MLDFLSEEKRNILMDYPFVTEFLIGKLEREIFLDNLKAFGTELTEKGITSADIKSLVQYALKSMFPEYYKEKAGSKSRIKNIRIPNVNDGYSLIAIHVSRFTDNINSNIETILEYKQDRIKEILYFREDDYEMPNFLHPTATYEQNRHPTILTGSRYIITGTEAYACVNASYRVLLGVMQSKIVEISIPIGALYYKKLEDEGGTLESDNNLCFNLVYLYFKNTIEKRGQTALYFDGVLIDLYGTNPATLLHFYSSTKKFVELSK